jgi:hypothetical protein
LHVPFRLKVQAHRLRRRVRGELAQGASSQNLHRKKRQRSYQNEGRRNVGRVGDPLARHVCNMPEESDPRSPRAHECMPCHNPTH